MGGTHDPAAGATTERQVLRSGEIGLWWDADRRLAVMRFLEPGTGNEAQASEIVEHLEELSDHGAEPYSFLVDCSSLLDGDAGWRTRFADHFKRDRDVATIAWFNASPRVRLLILMFRTGTGVQGESFATEEQAREWLAGQT